MKIRTINIKEFLILKNSLPIIDVRSPGEFRQGHIPEAFSVPLFSDEDRSKVGKVYIQKGRDESMLLALDLVGNKLKEKIILLKENCKSNRILIHCWRGGMRSEAMAWLFSLFNFECMILDGGYKSYRRFLRESFSRKAKLIVLGGMTGSGKTEILETLENNREQVINLEKLACHKGSAFGNLGMPSQPTTEQFENNLFENWHKLNLSKIVWIENESKNIGKVIIPSELFSQILHAPLVDIKLDKKNRIERLVKEYTVVKKEFLIESIKKIEKRLGGLNARLASDAISMGHFAEAAEILLFYYDKAYQEEIAGREKAKVFSVEISNTDIYSFSKKILDLLKQQQFYGID